jgi:hypothetical protein
VEKVEVFAVLYGFFEEMRRRWMVFCGEKRGESVIKLERYLVFHGVGKYAIYFRFIFGGRHDLCKAMKFSSGMASFGEALQQLAPCFRLSGTLRA